MSVMVSTDGKCSAAGCFNQGTKVCRNCGKHWCLSHFRGFHCRVCDGLSLKEASEYKVSKNGKVTSTILPDSYIWLLKQLESVTT